MEHVEIRTIKTTKDNRAFLGFYCDPHVKGKVMAVADHYGVSVSQLLAAFAAHADTLCWFVPLGEEEKQKETRQLAG